MEIVKSTNYLKSSRRLLSCTYKNIFNWPIIPLLFIPISKIYKVAYMYLSHLQIYDVE